ncbi:hypothetical protein NST99_06995 [Paenibacillus sp. FSL L8-0470]|uniref:hypothetical protein n=1 Tax=Paenibacillus sp. FSL L8-0470 TaxID=2954688 RepID=UPI0030F80A34
MIINIHAELAAAQIHLECAINAMLQQRNLKHVTSLGKANYLTRETLVALKLEEAGHESKFRVS